MSELALPNRRTIVQPAPATLWILLALVATRCLSLNHADLDWDEGVYITMAQRWLAGGLPYVAVWDQHPPGLPALFALAALFIRDPVLGPHVAALLAVGATAFILRRFAQRFLGRSDVGVVAALFYIASCSRWQALAANTEIFNNAATAMAAYLLASGLGAQHLAWRNAVAAAFILGLGLQIKYAILPECVLLCGAYVLYKTFRGGAGIGRGLALSAAMLLAGLLPAVAVMGYFIHSGALPQYLAANVGSNLAYLAVLPSLRDVTLQTVSGLFPIAGSAALCAYAWTRRAALPTGKTTAPWFAMRWLTLWGVAAAINVCLPMKFFPHYFFALYPPGALLGALAFCRLKDSKFLSAPTGLAILFIPPLLIFGIGQWRIAKGTGSDAPREIAAAIHAAGPSAEGLYVYNYNPVVYALARVEPPTPYILTSELDEYSRSSGADGVREVARVMGSKPAFVVVQENIADRRSRLDEVILTHLSEYHLAQRITDAAGLPLLLYAR